MARNETASENFPVILEAAAPTLGKADFKVSYVHFLTNLDNNCYSSIFTLPFISAIFCLYM